MAIVAGARPVRRRVHLARAGGGGGSRCGTCPASTRKGRPRCRTPSPRPSRSGAARGCAWWRRTSRRREWATGGRSAAAIEMIQQARDEGVRVWADQYPYPTSGTDGRTVLIPRWATDDEDAASAADARPPADMLETRLRGPGDGGPDQERHHPRDRTAGRRQPDRGLRASQRGVHREESGRDRVRARGGPRSRPPSRSSWRGDRNRRGGGRFRGFSMSEDDVENYAGQPWVATASDGGVACRATGRSTRASTAPSPARSATMRSPWARSRWNRRSGRRRRCGLASWASPTEARSARATGRTWSSSTSGPSPTGPPSSSRTSTPPASTTCW